MAQINLRLPQARPLAATARTDSWWVTPGAIAAGLLVFIVYATWAALQPLHYYYHGPAGQNYISPFFSPLFYDTAAAVEAGRPSTHAWFGGSRPGWWPAWLLFAPSFLILWAPAGFRFTCYGFRGHYYKGLWADPLNCAVGEPAFRGTRYRGERYSPLTIQNIHRYFFYVIVLLLAVKVYDTVKMLFFFRDAADHSAGHTFGVGIGTLVLVAEPVLLALYVFGCHSYRHLVGGRKDCLSDLGPRRRVYDCVTCLNRRHMFWGWASLLWIMFADAYVRLCSMGVVTDAVLFKW